MGAPDVRKGHDWVSALGGGAGERVAGALRDLDLGALRRYPPPRTGGFPIGHEGRILVRFAAGDSNMLDQSAISGVYRLAAGREARLRYDAFALGLPTAEAHWDRWLGPEEVEHWRGSGLLVPGPDGSTSCSFRAVTVGGATLVADHDRERRADRVHLGQDSLNLVAFLRRRTREPVGSLLDVGTGTGAVLLANRGVGERVGVDINPRAVAVARFNVVLNRQRASVVEGDVFTLDSSLGKFDRIVWNAPFMFVPDTVSALDGDGGHLGIELSLRFLDVLPELLAPSGRAYLLTLGPILRTGERPLRDELRRRAAANNLEVLGHVLQLSWSPSELAAFHAEHGIEKFESVVLEIARGRGGVDWRPAALPARITGRAVSWLRGRVRPTSVV